MSSYARQEARQDRRRHITEPMSRIILLEDDADSNERAHANVAEEVSNLRKEMTSEVKTLRAAVVGGVIAVSVGVLIGAANLFYRALGGGG